MKKVNLILILCGVLFGFVALSLPCLRILTESPLLLVRDKTNGRVVIGDGKEYGYKKFFNLLKASAHKRIQKALSEFFTTDVGEVRTL